MPDRKTFRIDVAAEDVRPTLHHISLSAGDEIEWMINDGNGRVVFDPAVGDPVTWRQGPDFERQNPALGTGKTTGTYFHTVAYWYDLGLGGNKQQHSLQMVLIVDP